MPSSEPADRRSGPVVILAIAAIGELSSASRESLLASLPDGDSLLEVAAQASAVNGAIRQAGRADVVVVDEPCVVAAGWIERLRDAAHADTNIASASALADRGTALAVSGDAARQTGLDALAAHVAGSSGRLRPRITRAVGPCVYLRRDALDLVGGLDEQLELRSALEFDLSQRCCSQASPTSLPTTSSWGWRRVPPPHCGRDREPALRPAARALSISGAAAAGGLGRAGPGARDRS